jgi:hypothetical protein
VIDMSSEEWTDKPSRKSAGDPVADKRKDAVRQRKIVSNGSDKAARRHEVRIKTTANRTIRRKDKVLLNVAAETTEDTADAIRSWHRAKPKHWGTINAADRRRSLREKDSPSTPRRMAACRMVTGRVEMV